MQIPQSLRYEIEIGGALLLCFVFHLLLVACIVAEVKLWEMLPEDDPVLEISAKVATLVMLAVLIVADVLFTIRLVRRMIWPE